MRIWGRGGGGNSYNLLFKISRVLQYLHDCTPTFAKFFCNLIENTRKRTSTLEFVATVDGLEEHLKKQTPNGLQTLLANWRFIDTFCPANKPRKLKPFRVLFLSLWPRKICQVLIRENFPVLLVRSRGSDLPMTCSKSLPQNYRRCVGTRKRKKKTLEPLRGT